MTTSKTAERAQKALELFLAGATYEQVAQTLGFANRGAAFKAVQAALAARPAALPDEAVQTGIARLDALLGGLWAKARRGDVAAVDRVLKIEERRHALLTLSAQTTAVAPSADRLDELRARRDRKRGGGQ